jgi:hypothetical protein
MNHAAKLRQIGVRWHSYPILLRRNLLRSYLLFHILLFSLMMKKMTYIG